MNTAFYIAKRYLFAKKSTNAINIISGISMLSVFIGSAALIIILSVYNGFEEMILKMYNTITPDLVILPQQGKTFDPQATDFLKKDPSVANYVEVLQENALVKIKNRQSVALVKGLSDSFLRNKALDSIILEGNFNFRQQGLSTAVMGVDVQDQIGANVKDPLSSISIYSPKKGASANSINSYDDFVISNITPVGIFSVDQYYNSMIFVPLGFARELFQIPTQVSAIEIKLKEDVSLSHVQDQLTHQLGSKYMVNNKFQQNKLLYQILVSEKWAIYLILTFILIIAIFNIIGSLTMLVIDKVKDIAILSSLGATKTLVRRVFFLEGLMITFVGCVLGLLLGYLFCLGQLKFHWIKMDSKSFAEAFPIHLKPFDFVLVFTTVMCISLIASVLSSAASVKRIHHLKEDL